LTRGGCHNRWRSLASCDHRDAITRLTCTARRCSADNCSAPSRHPCAPALSSSSSAVAAAAAGHTDQVKDFDNRRHDAGEGRVISADRGHGLVNLSPASPAPPPSAAAAVIGRRPQIWCSRLATSSSYWRAVHATPEARRPNARAGTAHRGVQLRGVVVGLRTP
jgi:hypothetical protein